MDNKQKIIELRQAMEESVSFLEKDLEKIKKIWGEEQNYQIYDERIAFMREKLKILNEKPNINIVIFWFVIYILMKLILISY